MKTYTVTQKGGYQILTTVDKKEAEAKLAEMLKYCSSWYICEQGYNEPIKQRILDKDKD